MRLPRRRHQIRRFSVTRASAAFALFSACALLLLLITLPSYLAPSLSDHHGGRATTLSRSFDLSSLRRPLVSRGEAVRKNAMSEEPFRVPHDGGSVKNDLWRSKLSKSFFGCSNASNKFLASEDATHRGRYLMIETSGGLNQQRTGIIDAVVAARILNATLIVPKLDQRSFWKDASEFRDIFDVDWFISSLSRDVKIIKELPMKRGKNFKGVYTMRVPRKCNPRCYQNRVLPVLQRRHVVELTKFDYRLANKLETDLQKLRCRVNYHALKFIDPIKEMGEKLIHRMKGKGNHFIALHLRFESDMLAFSGCYYGGGEKERRELGAIRRRWKNLHISNPDKARRQGRCPLTPEEVGLLLRALGYGKDVHIYVASGEIYGGDESLAPLKALFPHFHSKETLASNEELKQFSSFSSRMAALDFIVCDGSDAFVANNNGNMARILAGRRRYFGHKRTIRPNAKKLHSVFLNRANMSWEEFASKVRTRQRGFMGDPKEVRPGRGEFHENPSTCICEISEATTGAHSSSESQKFDDNFDRRSDTNYSNSQRTPDHSDSDLDWTGPDNEEYTLSDESPLNATDFEYNPLIRAEDSELEDILSD